MVRFNGLIRLLRSLGSDSKVPRVCPKCWCNKLRMAYCPQYVFIYCMNLACRYAEIRYFSE